MLHPFLELPYKSTLAEELANIAPSLPPQAWGDYYNFEASPIPQEVALLDPVLANLANHYDFQAGVLRLPPSTCYNWHTDTKRKVSINMLLSGFNSHCLFAKNKDDTVMQTAELKYKPSTYYVFDTQTPHTVINFNEPRYLFSVEFVGKDAGLTFGALCAEFEGRDNGG